MKKYLLLLIACFSLAAYGQNWQQLEDFPAVGRDDGTVFVIGNKAYCGLGMNAWFDCSYDMHIFDMNTESWSTGPGLPDSAARQYANGFAHNEAGYVFGGINAAGTFLNDLWKLYPETGSWNTLQSMPAAGRSGAISFVIADVAYIAGGRNASANALNEVWAYHFSDDSWTQLQNLPFDGTWRGVAFSWNGNGYVGLGKDNQNNLHEAWYAYTPETDSWEVVPDLHTQGSTYTAFAQVGELAFLYGGADASNGFLNTFTRLDLNTFGLHTLTELPATARRGGMAFAGNGTFYLTTGISATQRYKETWKAAEVLGLTANTFENEVSLFPNPAQGTCQIQATKALRQITVKDMCGKTISQNPVHGTTTMLELSFQTGVYLLEIKTETFLVMKKLAVN